MNKQNLRSYINKYKLNFDRVSQEEIYKWKAVKTFQDHWDINAVNFYEMLWASLSQTKNLLDSGQYFPLRMMVQYAEHRPDEVRHLFNDLYNEDNDLFERIVDFQTGINVINSELFENKKSYQDPRAVIVYLVLRFPERYFFYKFEMFKQFSEKLELIYKPIKGRIENIGHFNSQCELIRYELSLDQELLKLHKNRITLDCYYDENLNILTQDFIYAVARHLNQPAQVLFRTVQEPITVELLASELTSYADHLSFRGRTINFIQNGIENKRIGDLGELWVMKYEIEKLEASKKYNLIEQIRHTAKDEGDGTGFDIQSFDSFGNKIFIEVKTTKGNCNSTLFITRNELERSKVEKSHYYLYRVYNFDEVEDKADLLIIKGELTNLCEFPATYKVNLNYD